jgi:hypothetical protein
MHGVTHYIFLVVIIFTRWGRIMGIQTASGELSG